MLPILRLTDGVSPDELGDIIDTLGDVTASNVFAAVITAVVSLIVIKVLLTFLNHAFSKSKLDPAVRKLLRGLLRVILYFVAVILVLDALGIQVTSLVAVLSVIGLAMSLALQNFLSNVAGGMQLLASHPFKPGDWVEVGSIYGQVDEVGLFYTKVKTYDNKGVYLPNSTMVSSTIINYFGEELRWVEVLLSASYDSPTQLVLDTLRAMAIGNPLVLADKGIDVHVIKYGDSAIEYRLRMWCKSEHYWDVYFDIMDNLKTTFDAAGIEITYPHLNVHFDPHDPAAPPSHPSVPNAEKQ